MISYYFIKLKRRKIIVPIFDIRKKMISYLTLEFPPFKKNSFVFFFNRKRKNIFFSYNPINFLFVIYSSI